MLAQLSEEILINWNLGWVALILIGAFALMYFSMTGFFYWFYGMLVRVGICKKVMDHDYFENQIRFEMLHSLWSIGIFGLYGALIVFCYRMEVVDIRFEYDLWILWDLIILATWNEVHFWVLHRAMHTKALLPFHRTHHKSIVVTPFSTYSFHPLESLIFGTVMILPMLVYDFELLALVIFPIYHLFFNIMGHSNVELIKNPMKIKNVHISSRHNDHHTKFHLNFGFVSKLTDWAFGTSKLKKMKKEVQNK